jgi:hypothetical protein
MQIGFEEYLTGIFSVIITVIFLIVGLIITSKYREVKNKIFVLVGLSWIGLSFPWMAVSIHFLMLILLNKPLAGEIFFFIIIGIVPFTQICWIMAIADFTNVGKKRQLKILYISFILAVLMDVIFILMLLTDVSSVGWIEGTLLVKFTLFISIYLMVMVGIWAFIGFIFVRESLKSDNPEIRLKGKFLLLAFTSFIFGAITETLIMVITITVIGRIVLMISAFFFYCGFMLPRWIKELIMRE